MTSVHFSLEEFESDDSGHPVQSADYKRGYEAGMASAKLSEESARTEAIIAISSTLSDMSFGFAEARSYLISGLKPLLAQLAESALPSILHETFGAHLVEVITTQFEVHCETPIEISVSQNAFADLAELMPSDTTCSFQLTPDPNLRVGQAILRQENCHLVIDLPEMLATLQSALRGLESLERTTSHG